MASFLTLCARLTTRSGAIGTAPAAVTGQTGRQAKCVDWVMHAWQLIQQLHPDWSFLQGTWTGSTIASTPSYSAATFNIDRFGAWAGDRMADRGLYRPTTLYDPDIGVSDEGELIEIPFESWRQAYDRGSQTPDKPRYYCIAPDQTIRFGPIPDKAYAVRGEYRKSPQTLAANDDEPDMPAAFHDIIVDRALILMSEHDEAPQGLTGATRAYTEKLSSMRRELLPQIGTILGR